MRNVYHADNGHRIEYRFEFTSDEEKESTDDQFLVAKANQCLGFFDTKLGNRKYNFHMDVHEDGMVVTMEKKKQ